MKSSKVVIFLLLFSITLSCGRELSLEDLGTGGNDLLRDTIDLDGLNPPSLPELRPYFESAYFSKEQVKTDTIDIIYSIDNSGSMDPYIDKVVDNMELFLGKLLEERVDFQIGLLNSVNKGRGTDFNDLPMGNPRVLSSSNPRLQSQVKRNFSLLKESEFNGGVEIPVGVILRSLNNSQNFGANGIYRVNVGKVFIILTDADEYIREGTSFLETNRKVSEISAELNKNFVEDPWTFILIGSDTIRPFCPKGESGNQAVMKRLVDVSGGSLGRICDNDYTQNMQRALQTIFSALISFPLGNKLKPDALVNTRSIRCLLDGQEVQQDIDNGFSWNPTTQVISFLGSVKPQAGQLVEVYFEYLIP